MEELEMLIACFPADRHTPTEAEWGLFSTALDKFHGKKDKESRSRLKAAKIVWNKFLEEEEWDDVDEYSDVEAWAPTCSRRELAMIRVRYQTMATIAQVLSDEYEMLKLIYENTSSEEEEEEEEEEKVVT
jgi:hypothetical protein